MYHRFSLSEIVAWLLRGIWQTILLLIPLVDPWPERGNPPAWWWYWYSYWDWHGHLNTWYVPDRHFIECYLRGAWSNLGVWIEEVGDGALARSKDAVRSWIGYVRHGWARFDDWIDSIGFRVGVWAVSWAENTSDSLRMIWGWLPEPVRTNLLSAAEWMRVNLDVVRQWVKDSYGWLIDQGKLAWIWVLGIGVSIQGWWNDARGTLDEFRANPSAFILSRLGHYWNRLTWFSNNILDYYAGLWSAHAKDLADLLADPAGWMFSRLEAYLERHW